MPMTSGSVSILDDGTAVGIGFAAVLFQRKLAALEAMNPSPIAVPSVGDRIGQTTILATQADVDRAQQQRVSTLRSVAAECSDAASVIDYILANAEFTATLTTAQSAGRMPASTAVNTPIQGPATDLVLTGSIA